MKRYAIEVNETQLRILSRACDLFARLRATQLDEIEGHLPKAFWRLPFDTQMEFREKIRDLEAELRAILGLSRNASYGVCNPENTGTDCDIAFDLNEVFRHELWHSSCDDDPSGDPLSRVVVMASPAHKWSGEPLAVIRALQPPVRRCNAYMGCEVLSANVCGPGGEE